MPRKALKKTPEEVITIGTARRDIPRGVLSSTFIPKGAKVEIARIVRTPIGLSFRVKNSIIWVSEDDIDVQYNPEQIYDYTGTRKEEMVPESWKAKGKYSKSPKLKEKTASKSNAENNSRKQLKNRIRHVTNDTSPIRGQLRTGAKKMEKQKLKDVLQTLTPGSEVTVTFRGDKADQSGTFTVVQTKRGRGKGGSQLVELKTAEGETLVTGTPESDSILHVVTPDGTLHGFETEDQVPPTFETDATRALELKRAFKALTQYCNPLPKEGERDTRSRFAPEGRVLLHVGSTHEPFAGAFELREVELKRGRYGKVTLTVAPTTGDGTLVLDSFQHSGVIRDFTVREPQTDS